MNTTIRVLKNDDYPCLEAMNTGIEDDYVKRIFNRLVTGNNRLFGLFLDGKMISLAGYSIYADRYAMLGKLRSDIHFKGNGYSTALVRHVMNEAFQLNQIKWVGANTQEHNISAQRVLEKVGLTRYITIHGAITKDTSALVSGAKPWNPITDMVRKKEWVEEMYIKPSSIFPYECYYPFPGSKDLFHEHDLKRWSFYENETKTRVLITKADQKKHHYLHAVYPWNDITSQKGLWETISADYRKLAKETEDDTYIWMDLTKEEAKSLPTEHQFELPSPWMLYGMDRSRWEAKKSPS